MSEKLRPAERTSISTRTPVATGSGTSFTSSSSGPPRCEATSARICVLSARDRFGRGRLGSWEIQVVEAVASEHLGGERPDVLRAQRRRRVGGGGLVHRG